MSSCQFSKPQHATATRNGPFHLKPQKKLGLGLEQWWTKGFLSSEQSLGSCCCCYMLLHAATCCYPSNLYAPRAAHAGGACALQLVPGDSMVTSSDQIRMSLCNDGTFRHTHKRAHTNCICTHATNRTSTCRKTCRSTYISTQHLKTIHLNLVQTNPSPELSYYHNVYMRVLGATGTWLGCSLPCITT
jgi:hypothetical protein